MNKNITLNLFFIILITLFSTGKLSAETNFDHSTTGFLLTGQHNFLSCESCHIRGIFKGLPDTCEGCHEDFSLVGGSLKPITHVTTRASCDDCHTDNSWAAIRMDHADVTQDCVTCHNGIKYTGKPSNHIQSSDTCDDCHLQVSWIPARFDHFGVTDNCVFCHNGTTAIGKHINHVTSNDVCDDCHTTNGWLPALYNHNGIDTNCVSCHNGLIATGKNLNHVISDDVCEVCHTNTISWKPALFDHTNINDTCVTCHNGIIATGKDSGHFITDRQCDDCHYESKWSLIKDYLHISDNYPGKHGVSLSCFSCHKEKTENLGWVTSSYYPECGACHANDYEPNKHEGAPVTDNLDCAGLCHKDKPEHQIFHTDWEL